MQTILIGTVLLVVLTGQSCSSGNAPPRTGVEQSTSGNANKLSYDQSISSDGFVVEQNSTQPVKVTEVKLAKGKLKDEQGNLLLTIKNIGEKPIVAVRYWLFPPSCQQYKIPAQHIDYGDKATLSQNSVGQSSNLLLPSQSTILSVELLRLSEYLSAQTRAGCSSNDKPTISLVKVVFTDGEVWDFTKQANRNP